MAGRVFASAFVFLALAFGAGAYQRTGAYKSSPFSRSMDVYNRAMLASDSSLPMEERQKDANEAVRNMEENRLRYGPEEAAARIVQLNACTGAESNASASFDMCAVPDAGNFSCDVSSLYRTMDGTCNNLANPSWGAVNTPFVRLVEPGFYVDGIGVPYGSSAFNFRVETKDNEGSHGRTLMNRNLSPLYLQATDRRRGRRGCHATIPNQLPEPRTVSKVFHTDADLPDDKVSLLLMQFGQFLDHDITLTPEVHIHGGCCDVTMATLNNQDCMAIPVSPGDSFVHNHNLTCLNFHRSTPFCLIELGTREQFNIITHFVDLSNIYASSESFGCTLRDTSAGRLLSQVQGGQEYLPLLPDGRFEGPATRLTSGDIRTLEMPGLASMHTLFMREHNRIALELNATYGDSWSNDRLFQEAKRINTAVYQNIVYGEFLRAVLGDTIWSQQRLGTRSRGSVYYPRVDPSMTNEFATAAYRFGHTLVQGIVQTLRASNNSPLSNYTLRDALFNTDALYDFDNAGVDNVLAGIMGMEAQTYDRFIAKEVTEFVRFDFSGLRSDLMARNIQRSRDHGLRGYNQYRRLCKRDVSCTWSRPPSDISMENWRKLSQLYNHPNDIELFPGGLAENSTPGGIVGRTFACIIADSFKRAKHGDRFFFGHRGLPHSFSTVERAHLLSQTMGGVMCRNTGITQARLSVFELGGALVDCDQHQQLDLSVFHSSFSG